MKRLKSLLLFLLFIPLLIYSQRPEVQILKERLAEADEDQAKVEIYLDLSSTMLDSLPSEAQYYARKGLNLAKELSYLEGEENARIFLGMSLIKQNQNRRGVRMIERSLPWVEGQENPQLQAEVYLNLSNAFSELGRIKISESYLQKLLLIQTTNQTAEQQARITVLEKKFKESEYAAYAAELAALKAKAQKDSVVELAMEQQIDLLRLEKVAAQLEADSLESQLIIVKKQKQVNQLIAFVIIFMALLGAFWQYRRIQKARNRVEREKQEAKRLRQLVSSIAHEIKNPLNYVHNFAHSSEELTEELLFELEEFSIKIGLNNFKNIQEIITDIKENVNFILNSGKRVDNIVNNMISKAEYKPGKFTYQNVNDILEEHSKHASKGVYRDEIFLPINLVKTLDP